MYLFSYGKDPNILKKGRLLLTRLGVQTEMEQEEVAKN